MCELGLMTGERATGALDGADCGREDCVRKMFFKSEIKCTKKKKWKEMDVRVCVCVFE